jgi:hypothetical protein
MIRQKRVFQFLITDIPILSGWTAGATGKRKINLSRILEGSNEYEITDNDYVFLGRQEWMRIELHPCVYAHARDIVTRSDRYP